MYDLVNDFSVQLAKTQGNLTSDTNSSQVIDLLSMQGPVMILTSLSAVATADGSNYFTIKVEESDDSGFSTGVTEVTADANRIIGTQTVVNATSMAASVKKFGVTVGLKRYMRIVLDETGTADITGQVIAVVGSGRNQPVA